MGKNILVLHPAIAPYRLDFFNSLNDSFDMHLCLFYKNLSSLLFDHSKVLSQANFEPSYVMRNKGVIGFIKGILKELKSCNPDLVLVSEFSLSALVSVLYKLITRKKYKIVSIVDDSYNMLSENNSFSKKHKYATRIMTPFFDEIINVEPRVANWYQKHYGKGLYFPIICDEVKSRERLERILSISNHYVQEYNLEGKKVLLFVGRLVGLKNIPFAIDAFIEANLPNSVFILVGAGDDEQKIRDTMSAYNNVLMVGRCEGDELYAWYNVAQIFTLPSILEPFGAVTNEALVAGCKVLVSSVAGSNCLVKDGVNGFVIDPKDKGRYISALTRLMSESQPLTHPLKVKENQMLVSFNRCFNGLVSVLNNLVK